MGFALLSMLLMMLLGVFNTILLREGDETTGHPDHIHDVAQAFRWTREHIHAFQGDPSRIFIMGHSAGAHLVTLLALDASYLKMLGESADTAIKGTIAISGIYNFGRLKKAGFGMIGRHFYIAPLLRNNSDRTEGELVKELYGLSPLTFVRQTQIPFLFLNATIDFHLQKDAEEIVSELKLLGVDVEHRVKVQTDHGSIVNCMHTAADTVSPLVANWMKRHMD